MSTQHISHRIDKNNSLLMICDIQNKFAQKTFQYQLVLQSAQTMIKAANIYQIPIIISQSNTRLFSQTIPQLKKHLNQVQHPFIFKQSFSMLVPQVQQILAMHPQRKQIILIGMEAHVCILQTYLDLKDKGYVVHAPVDALTSIKEFQRAIGLKRLENQGALITSVETILFEMLRTAKNVCFREVIEIIDQYQEKKKLMRLV